MIRGLAMGAALLVLTGCGASSTPVIVDGQAIRMVRPDGPPVGAAIWFHGQGGDQTSQIDGDWLGALVEDGWIVTSSNFYGNAWGNPQAAAHTANLVDWVRLETGMPVTLFVAGSMGSANSLNAMASAGLEPSCWYGVMPVVDLQAMGTVPDGPEQVEAAHEGLVSEDWNPAHRIDRLPTETAYRVLASPDETVVLKSQNADVLVEELQAAGADVSVRVVEGEHGHESHFDADDLAEFAAGCAL